MRQWFEGKTVALIGNATYLFDLSYGEEIDSHDVVVRLNKAAMLYTNMKSGDSHGYRTDVWMFWNANEYKNYFKNTKAKLMHMGHQGRNTGNRHGIDFMYPDEPYAKLRKVAGKHNNPTTGFMALDYIISCKPKSLDVYGFDWKETPTFTDPDRKKEKNCPHDYEAEKEHCAKFFFSRPEVTLKK
jgi:hypothetical protein